MARWGRIDVLVNSAGHGPRAPILEITDEQWHTGLDVYLMNVIRPTRLVAPIMQAQKAGAIINISTAWAFEPSAMFPTSAVFRAGLAAYTKIFADTYAADNVRMNNVLPGWIDSLPATEERRASVPMRRYGRRARSVRRDHRLPGRRRSAGYITGQNIRVDGRRDALDLTAITTQPIPAWPYAAASSLRPFCAKIVSDRRERRVRPCPASSGSSAPPRWSARPARRPSCPSPLRRGCGSPPRRRRRWRGCAPRRPPASRPARCAAPPPWCGG